MNVIWNYVFRQTIRNIERYFPTNLIGLTEELVGQANQTTDERDDKTNHAA